MKRNDEESMCVISLQRTFRTDGVELAPVSRQISQPDGELRGMERKHAEDGFRAVYRTKWLGCNRSACYSGESYSIATLKRHYDLQRFVP